MVQDAALVVIRTACRMFAPSLAALALVVGAAMPAAAQDDPAAQQLRLREEDRLAALFADDAARDDALDPMGAVYRGDVADPAALALLFTDELDRRRRASAELSLRRLAAIDRGRLGAEARLSFDVFRIAKQDAVGWLSPDIRALTAVRPFNHFGGLHVEFPSMIAAGGAIPYADEADYDRALALEAAFPQVLDNAVARFREGMAQGVTESQLTVANMIGQIDAALAQPVAASPFTSPLERLPDGMSRATREGLRRAFQRTTAEQIYPAYRRLRRFLAEEYLPAARGVPGLAAMKGGDALYRRLIRRETSLGLDPAEIHRLGLEEVARIRREMETVRTQMGFGGSLDAFFDHLRDDPRFHPKSAQELAEGYARIARTVHRQIPRFFNRTPAAGLTLSPYPAFRERYEPGGSYQQGSPDGSRAGTFFYNTYDLAGRTLTGMTTLYLHEGIPGHHFQISLAQENRELPPFQRFEGNNAYVEGWALYAESLGYEMGLFADPAQHWGNLDDEMLRAMRLVVDTGLHAQGWSREQAIAYMLANSGMSRTDATVEVERYVANPAQALSYKIGAITIRRLRTRAERALGPKFDLRAFHDQVLGSGALPLPVLEAKIDGWVEAMR